MNEKDNRLMIRVIIILLVMLFIIYSIFMFFFLPSRYIDSIQEKHSQYGFCDENTYDCEDFNSCQEVMDVFTYCKDDVHYLDGDDDGIPCESLCS